MFIHTDDPPDIHEFMAEVEHIGICRSARQYITDGICFYCEKPTLISTVEYGKLVLRCPCRFRVSRDDMPERGNV